MGTWKTLREEHPQNFSNVIVLTKTNKLEKAFWSNEEKKFYVRVGLIRPIQYKRWCYEEDLVETILKEIGNV